MNAPSPQVARPPWIEGTWVTLLIATPVVLWITSLDGLSFGWDTLNHHFYLGWMAIEGSRLQHDVFAAGSMSCQYPYAYAPLYLLERSGATGQQAALVLALPALVSIPAIWLVSWSIFPISGYRASATRLSWTGLGFLSSLWWSLLDHTSNDLSSALPIVWAYAIVVWRAAVDWTAPQITGKFIQRSMLWMAVAGALSALALTFKISHAFALLMLTITLLITAPDFRAAGLRLVAFSLGGILVAATVWWPWAKTVWIDCGSPVYPMLLEQLRPWGARLP